MAIGTFLVRKYKNVGSKAYAKIIKPIVKFTLQTMCRWDSLNLELTPTCYYSSLARHYSPLIACVLASILIIFTLFFLIIL